MDNTDERISTAFEKHGINPCEMSVVRQMFERKPEQKKLLADWLESGAKVTDGSLIRKECELAGIPMFPDPAMPTDMETDIPDEPDW